jgi:hypothetical protein
MLAKLLFTLPRARRWVHRIVAQHRSVAVPLRESEGAESLVKVFGPLLIEGTKVAVVDQTPRPPLAKWGLEGADDFVGFEAAGLALIDTIFVRRNCVGDPSLLFHELVHVAQWRLLGVNRFLALYGLMLLEDGYRASPLETMAYGLQRQFVAGRRFDALPVIRRQTQEVLVEFGRRSIRHGAIKTLYGGNRLRLQ